MEDTLNAAPPATDTFDEGLAIFNRWQAQEAKAAEPAAEKPADPVAQQEESPKEEAPKEDKSAEPNKEEAKKTEPKGDDDTPASAKTPEAKNAWTALKQELKELREQKLPASEKLALERQVEIETLQKKIAELEKRPIDQYESRIKDLETRLAEEEKFRAIHDVTSSEAYVNDVLVPAEKIGEENKQLAALYDVPLESLQAAMKIEDPIEQRRKINSLTEGWNPMDAADFARNARSMKELVNKSESLIANADKAKGELKFLEEQKAKQKAEADEAAFQAASSAADKTIAEKFPFLKEHPELAEAMKAAKFQDSPVNRAIAAKMAHLFPTLNDKYHKAMEELNTLKEQLAKRDAAKPRPTSTNTATPSSKGNEDVRSAQDADDIMRNWQNFRAA